MQFDVSPFLHSSADHAVRLLGDKLGRTWRSLWSGCRAGNLHPEKTVTHRFTLDQAGEAYDVADKGQSGKVTIVYD